MMRNSDGYYSVRGCVEWCSARAKVLNILSFQEYLKYADGLWMETGSPDLIQAQNLTFLLDYENDVLLQNKILSYNLSPSFNWSNFNLTDEDLFNFSSKLAEFGFSWQVFILDIYSLSHWQDFI